MGRKYRIYDKIVTEPLTEENRKYWFKCVRNYLIAADIWNVIDGSISKPPEDDEDHKEDFLNWKQKNAAALHAILVSCGPLAFPLISRVYQAKDAWNILNHAYNCNQPLDSDPEPELALEDESESESESEPESEFESESELDLKPELKSKLALELESKSKLVLELESESESESQSEPESKEFESESESEPQPKSRLALELEPKPELALEPELELEPQPEVALEPELEPQPELALEPELEPEPESELALKPEPEPNLVLEVEAESEISLESEPVIHSSPQAQGREEEVNYEVGDVYKAICDNKWNIARAILKGRPSALSAKVNGLGQTALHVAASLGRVRMVEELVALLPSPKYLELLDEVDGFTPLATAAKYSGDLRLARCMVNKNVDIIAISTSQGLLPVTLAIMNGHRQMGRFLYYLTPLQLLTPENGDQGIWLLYRCFNVGELGIAVHLLQHCPDLLLAKDENGQIPVIMKIASMPSAFFSLTPHLVFWKRWIYYYINKQSTTDTNSVHDHLNIQQQGECEIVKGDHSVLSRFISKVYNMLGMKELHEMALVHAQADKILSLLCKKVRLLDSNMINERSVVSNAMFRAASEGNVDFLMKVSKEDPQLEHIVNAGTQWNIFFIAVAYRQPKVFNLIHRFHFKDKIASNIDSVGNTMLHVVAELAPSSKLNRISGPAFQMQSEMQWFKEVEKVMPQGYDVYQNYKREQAIEVFKDRHELLRKEGEKWMKETASSCSVVGALVVTIMFAAAFTVPGGNQQDFGYPLFLESKLFLVFVISDALSLFSSTTSVLLFLGILTSRYAEEDFLISLPRKLIIGLSTLFLSIATMVIAFSATILLMLQHTSYSWINLPFIMLASVPVISFAFLQFRLLLDMIYSTYGPSIFKS